MSKPRLYGVVNSRALRSIWAIEEVGIDYELVPTSFAGDSKKPEYLAINPNGRVPALVDGDVTLFESMAINLYLAKTYGGDLYPTDPADEARTWQWSIWGLTELEPSFMDILVHKLMLPEEQRQAERVATAEKTLPRPLKVLDAHLEGREHVLGGAFTIADLNVAGAVMLSGMVGYDLSPYANVARWFTACQARPSMERARKAGG